MIYRFLLFILILYSHTFTQIYQGEMVNSPNDIMPVELIYFYANTEGTIVNLFWGTATEVNNYGYDIEKSTESSSFNVIGFMKGFEHSNSPMDYFFADSSITQNGTYKYRLKQIDTDGISEYSDTIEVTINSVGVSNDKYFMSGFRLFQNYPNPFNPATIISFELPAASYVQLIIYDALGRELKTLINNELQPGLYKYKISLQDLSKGERNISISSGLYFYSIFIDNGKKKFIETKKMTIIK